MLFVVVSGVLFVQGEATWIILLRVTVASFSTTSEQEGLELKVMFKLFSLATL